MRPLFLLLLSGCPGGSADDREDTGRGVFIEIPPGASCCAPEPDGHDLALTQWPYSFGDVTGDGVSDVFVAVEGPSDEAVLGFIEGPLIGTAEADQPVLRFNIGAHYDLSFRVAILGPGAVAVSRVEHYPIPDGEVWLYSGSPAEPGWADQVAVHLEQEFSSFGSELFPVGDADGDGRPDVVVMRGWEGLFLSGEGSSVPWSFGSVGYDTMSPGDVNGDGISEILISPSSGSVQLIRGPVGRFEDPEMAGEDVLTFEGGSWQAGGYSLAGGDFDDDGYDDITFGGYREVSGHRSWIFLGPVESGDRQRAHAQLLFASDHGVNVSSAGDLDGDGNADLLAEGAGGVAVLLAPFEGVLDMTGIVECPAYGLLRSTSGAVDLDGDGFSDLAVGTDGPADEAVLGFLGPF